MHKPLLTLLLFAAIVLNAQDDLSYKNNAVGFGLRSSLFAFSIEYLF